MAISRSANPALNKSTFVKGFARNTDAPVMTLQGTVNRTFIMLILVVLGAVYTWNRFFEAPPELAARTVSGWMIGGGIGGFVVALVTIFRREWSPFTVPVYAVLEGLFLGALSAFVEAQYQGQGLVMQAVALTFATLLSLLIAYKTKLIKVTQNFRLGVFAATGGIALLYLISFILGLFGVQVSFIHGNSTLSILVSVVVIVVAALNLVLDFDFIEKGARAGVPKYMEWYAAFGLMVTLIWLYIEFLRLLSKLAGRN
ncbi:MAG TPA: Bax inhibitor-1/YccA family protein [Bacteroidetes bacterium]|nr:Bax inhibitor-1/YccA family protein [Bacteroidota bacterium]